MATRLGKLRERITIQKPPQTDDLFGGKHDDEDWIDVKHVWASIEPVSANQVFFSQSLEHRVTHKVIIRTFDDLESNMRIKFGERIFQIQSYRDFMERDRFTEIMAEEGAAS